MLLKKLCSTINLTKAYTTSLGRKIILSFPVFLYLIQTLTHHLSSHLTKKIQLPLSDDRIKNADALQQVKCEKSLEMALETQSLVSSPVHNRKGSSEGHLLHPNYDQHRFSLSSQSQNSSTPWTRKALLTKLHPPQRQTHSTTSTPRPPWPYGSDWFQEFEKTWRSTANTKLLPKVTSGSRYSLLHSP